MLPTAPTYAYVVYKDGGKAIVAISLIKDCALSDVNDVQKNKKVYWRSEVSGREAEEGYYDGDVVVLGRVLHRSACTLGSVGSKVQPIWVFSAIPAKQPGVIMQPQLMRALWQEKDLKDRSVTGKACNRKVQTGAQAKPALTSEKLGAVRDGLREYIRLHRVPNLLDADRLRKMKQYIACLLRDVC
ncbi:uncharacterized protein LOC144129082 [Amblyomma americanum]